VTGYVRRRDGSGSLLKVRKDGYVGDQKWDPAVWQRSATPATGSAVAALLANLEFAVWCLENPGMGPTPDALANMKTAIARAKEEVQS
jgi:hypothetical protein